MAIGKTQGANYGADMTAWDAVMKSIVALGRLSVRVGVLASRGGNASASGRGDITITEQAAINEFGSPAAGVPERSFIRSTFLIRRAQAMQTMIGRLAVAIVDRGLAPRAALELLGLWGSTEVKNTITEIDVPPPNAQRTIDRKGSSKPLVDTGRMLDAINHEVVED